jgi:4-deoxy-L-threo-5-hexosulose-uronate ketol-isomerase
MFKAGFARDPSLRTTRKPDGFDNMNSIDIRHAVGPEQVQKSSTEDLRRHFLVTNMFSPDRITATAFDYDRMMVMGAQPLSGPLELGSELASYVGCSFFLERREMGIVNIGGPGKISSDNKVFELGTFDGMYLGRGTRNVQFESVSAAHPAKFYINSVPAHEAHPARVIARNKLRSQPKGDLGMANRRSTNLYFHPENLPTSQLTMGLTRLEEGSVWNSVPLHLHPQRMEVYFYFELDESLVFHIMGLPSATRHLVVRNEEAVVSPAWSVHCGAGLSRFSYIWGTAGENLRAEERQLPSYRDIF